MHRMETNLQSQEYFPVTDALCHTLLPETNQEDSFSSSLSFRRQKTKGQAGSKYSDALKGHARQILVMSHFNFPNWFQLSDFTCFLELPGNPIYKYKHLTKQMN